MWKRAAAVLAAGILFSSCTMWNKPAKGWKGATGGEKIEQLFWDDVKNKDWVAVERHLASTFTGTGPQGPMERASFLAQLKSYQLTGVSLSECVNHLNGEDLMITCVVQLTGATPAQLNTLSVWQQYQKGWVMVAHGEAVASRQ